ncbi:hypothetical protein L596_028414 [Steinernema carpocapsae]|uniref:Tyrosine-protein phosphatase domain-containing protein n=1 Tax=Steinernema carpocapsae TaxID=34508 RepID=A0A4U5LYD3_STECR|nr:hypothetical protein L596_028414 [Steinernema carpocapsae]
MADTNPTTEKAPTTEKPSRVDTVGFVPASHAASLASVVQNDDTSHSTDSLSCDGQSPQPKHKTSAQKKVAVKRAVDGWTIATLEKGVNGLAAEFLKARKDVDQREISAFRAGTFQGKNRFGDIPCIDCTRVVLKNAHSDYIHANYVSSPRHPKRFICTQAPMETTCIDFWRMVIQEKAKIIIMLCDFFEQNFSKCAFYYPIEKGQVLQFENYEIGSREVRDIRPDDDPNGGTIRATSLRIRSTSGSQKVMHYYVREWPDRKTCSPRLIVKLLTEVRSSDRPIVVHCSGGVGRAGTLVAIEVLLEKLIAGESVVDTDRILHQVRKQRACAISFNLFYRPTHNISSSIA